MPLDGAIKAMHATGRINHYPPEQQPVPGEMPVLYIALRNAAISAVDSAVNNAADCYTDTAVASLQGWQPEAGHDTFVKEFGPESAATLNAFARSVHTQTRHALFAAVEQIIRADFNFYDEDDPSEDPRLEMLRQALDRSEPELGDMGATMLVGVKS